MYENKKLANRTKTVCNLFHEHHVVFNYSSTHGNMSKIALLMVARRNIAANNSLGHKWSNEVKGR